MDYNSKIIHFLKCKWKDGGRGEVHNGVTYYDCWGMTRDARTELYNLPLLNERAGKPVENFKLRRIYYELQRDEMLEVENPSAGCVVAVLSRSGICYHVALVVDGANNKFNVLEIGEYGARCVPLSRFINDNSNRVVKYYVDKNLP